MDIVFKSFRQIINYNCIQCCQIIFIIKLFRIGGTYESIDRTTNEKC